MSKNSPRKVCVVLVDRANYGRLKPVMDAIADNPDLELQVIATGTMVLHRFDMPVKVVEREGFRVDEKIYIELEGSTPTTMAKSLGFGIVEFSSAFQRLEPDVVVVIGDRYEALAAAVSAAYMNVCIAHIQGGEVSGSIDESARHAISKLAHYHFPSTQRSADYLVRMGEDPETILGVGCPSGDLARRLDWHLEADVINGRGHGTEIDPEAPYLLTVFHPTTTEFGGEQDQIHELLEALDRLARPTVLLWPNIDAGSDAISKAIRVFRTRRNPGWLRVATNFEPENYHRVLANAACAIGNSSSFVRDAGFFGTPVVLVGDRQFGRETAEHVVACAPMADIIFENVEKQLAHGRYDPATLYGDGYVSKRISDALVNLRPYVQKRLNYVSRPPGRAEDTAARWVFSAGSGD